MAAVLHRTTFEHRLLVNTPDFDTGTWVINPDLSPVNGVPKKYWVLVGDVLSEMGQLAKDAVDAADAAALLAQKEAAVKTSLLADALDGFNPDVEVAGLDITVNIDPLVVDDVTTIVADATDTKTVMVCYIYNRDTDVFALTIYEKTTGLYADMLLEEEMVKCLGEWQVLANDTVLTPVV